MNYNDRYNIENLADSSKVWIYQADRTISQNEINLISEALKTFIDQWQAHGQDLFAGYAVLYNRFLVIAVDERKATASGCSIDSSVGAIRKLGSQLNVDFFNRLNLGYLDTNQSIHFMSMAEFQDSILNGNITKDTLVFNSLTPNLGEFMNHFISKLQDSWHSRMLV